MSKEQPMRRARRTRPLRIAAAASGTLLVLAACSSGGGGSSESGSAASSGGDTEMATSITSLDYWTDGTSSDAFQKIVDSCAEETGIEIKRESLPLKELLPRVLQGAASGTLPDLAFVDNVNVQQLAATGALKPITDYGLTTDDLIPGIVGAVTYEDQAYGISPGVNALALFYNKEMLAEAGIEPPTTWEELSAAAEALTTDTVRGLAVSAPASEEGTWQFLPFFWSNGAELEELNSPEAVEALAFMRSFIDNGSMAESVVNWSQADVGDQFLAGNAAMIVNGPWNISKFDEDGRVDYGIVPIPAPEAGAATVVPLGGEVGIIPASGADTEAAAAEVLGCITNDEHMMEWNITNTRVPPRESLTEEYLAELPYMEPFTETVPDARARTSELGENYPVVSQALWTAIQAVYSGAQSPEDALSQAQTASGQ